MEHCDFPKRQKNIIASEQKQQNPAKKLKIDQNFCVANQDIFREQNAKNNNIKGDQQQLNIIEQDKEESLLKLNFIEIKQGDQHYKKMEVSEDIDDGKMQHITKKCAMKNKQIIKDKAKHKKPRPEKVKDSRNEDQSIVEPPSHNKKNIIVTQGIDFVPLDNYFGIKDSAKVLEINKCFYSITLTQSNLAKDDNKFFIIQAVQVGDPPTDQYYLFTRWGRVGMPGQTSVSEAPLDRNEVIRQYHVKTQAKVNRGGYKVIEVNYEQGPIEEQQFEGYFGQSQLPWKVQELVKLIFDRKMMHSHMKEIGYDQKRSPLGLIAKKEIEKGYICLDKIMRVLKGETQVLAQSQKRWLLNDYSSQFYSAIPHDFGYLNMQAFVLNSEEKVKQKLEMLASLSQIQIYSELMREKSIHPEMCDIDIKYLKLHCQICPLASTEAYQTIRKYIQNTHASTHDKYLIQLMGIFELKREEEVKRYRKDLNNKMLLWHGSRLSNYVGILSEGLKIAPYQAPATGYMFGKGIYFADIVSKSANYCRPKDGSEGLMLLCQVALGEMNLKYSADYNAHNLPQMKQSTKGVGKYAPGSGEMIGQVFIPNGVLASTGIQQTPLLYNEYVVYNRQQVLCKYIVHVRFDFK